MIETLSQHLLHELREIEDSFVEDSDPSEREDSRAYREFVSALVDQLVGKRQQLSHLDTTKMMHWLGRIGARQEKSSLNPEQMNQIVRILENASRDSLDAKYSEELLARVPLFVNRTLKLAVLESKYSASDQTNMYIQEAARAYIFGLPLASVAISRAAMEQSLRDRLGYQQSADRVSFDELVKDAQKYGLLPKGAPGPRVPAIRNVNNRCNEVLHKGPVSDDEAFELLSAARSVIEELHSAEGI